jgi:four helix bundle protein
MAKIDSHRDLIVWQKAMDLTVEVYELTKLLPREETYRLTAQITRSVASVPANIAEGHSRSTRRDYANFLAIAKGSLMETETFLTLAIRLGYVSEQQARCAMGLITEVSKMIATIRVKLLTRENTL